MVEVKATIDLRRFGSRRFTLAILLVAALTSMASMCDDDDDSGTVVYTFNGTCAGDLTYAVGDSTEQVDNAPSGWSKSFSGHNGDFVYLSAQNNCSSGSVTVRINYRNGIVDEATSSGAFVIATASGSL